MPQQAAATDPDKTVVLFAEKHITKIRAYPAECQSVENIYFSLKFKKLSRKNQIFFLRYASILATQKA